MKKIIIQLAILTSIFSGFGLTAIVRADDLTVATPAINPSGDALALPASNVNDQGQYLQTEFLPKVTKSIIAFTGGLSLLFVIIGGIQILTDFGSEDQLGKAKKTLTYAIVGLLISILSFGIVQAIISINFYLKP